MADSPDVVVVGAGILGAASAYFATRAGLTVTVVEQGLPASGTTSRCEGNLLISDKELGAELALARYSLATWKSDLGEFAQLWEYQEKGGIIAATTPGALEGLTALVRSQLDMGVDAQPLDPQALREAEPHLTHAALGAAFYPEDSQVQPILAAAHLLRLAADGGARVLLQTPVTGFLRSGDAVTGVRTGAGRIHAGAVVNATGTWAGRLARLAGVDVPILPRRGYVLVTEPLPKLVHHKVYAADYVSDVGSSDAGLQASPVVEDTPAGTILIGSSRERVGFDSRVSTRALGRVARGAAALFPRLAGANVIRHYHGFRPYCPDHLPVIGADPRAPGLWHAAGHEGAGIGLSVGTGKLLAQALRGEEPEVSLHPFRPDRFQEDT